MVVNKISTQTSFCFLNLPISKIYISYKHLYYGEYNKLLHLQPLSQNNKNIQNDYKRIFATENTFLSTTIKIITVTSYLKVS